METLPDSGEPKVSTASPQDQNSILRRANRLVLVVAKPCNLACKYCFTPLAYSGPDCDPDLMSSEVAHQAVGIFLRLLPDGLASIQFFGGEPILNWDVIENTVQHAGHVSRLVGRKLPSFTIVTNGTLLDESKVDFLARHAFLVTVSLDGRAAVNDQQRVFPDGSGTFSRIAKSVQLLAARKIPLKCQATYTRAHVANRVSPVEVVRDLRQLGFETVHLVPAAGIWGLANLDEDTKEELTQAFFRLGGFGMDGICAQEPVRITQVTNTLFALLARERRRHVCPAGIDSFAVSTNGTIYPCYVMMNDQRWRMGNVWDDVWPGGTFAHARGHYLALQRDKFQECMPCPARDICSLCYGYRYFTSGDIGPPGGIVCSCFKGLAAGVIEAFGRIKACPERWRKLQEKIGQGTIFG